MPRTTVVFYREEDGTAPVVAWLQGLRRTNPRAIAVLLHALTKEDAIPKQAIDLAAVRKKSFDHDPAAHTYIAPEL